MYRGTNPSSSSGNTRPSGSDQHTAITETCPPNISQNTSSSTTRRQTRPTRSLMLSMSGTVNEISQNLALVTSSDTMSLSKRTEQLKGRGKIWSEIATPSGTTSIPFQSASSETSTRPTPQTPKYLLWENSSPTGATNTQSTLRRFCRTGISLAKAAMAQGSRTLGLKSWLSRKWRGEAKASSEDSLRPKVNS